MGGLDGRQVGMIGAAIRAVYAKAANLPGMRPRESMLQEELRAQAQEAQDQDAVDVAATLRNLADRLSEYCGEGTYAYLLDRETTVPSDARLVVFDTRRCPDSELRVVMFSIMEYITTTVERHWKAHKDAASRPGAPLFQGRSIMLIDEAWHLISRPETGEYANNLARRARHLGLVLIVMSQQLSDFDTEYGVALLGNCSQQLLLAQNPKEVPFIADTLQLSDREAAELARLKTVKGRHAQMLWLNGTRGRGKVALRVGPTEYWAFTSDPTEAAMRETELAATRQRVGGDQNARQTRHARAPRPAARSIARARRDGPERTRASREMTSGDRAAPQAADSIVAPEGHARRLAVVGTEPTADHSGARAEVERGPMRRPRAAAGGLRPLRRRRREHGRVSDRAGRRSRRPASRCWSPTPEDRAAACPVTPASRPRGRWWRRPSTSRPGYRPDSWSRPTPTGFACSRPSRDSRARARARASSCCSSTRAKGMR